MTLDAELLYWGCNACDSTYADRTKLNNGCPHCGSNDLYVSVVPVKAWYKFKQLEGPTNQVPTEPT